MPSAQKINIPFNRVADVPSTATSGGKGPATFAQFVVPLRPATFAQFLIP